MITTSTHPLQPAQGVQAGPSISGSADEKQRSEKLNAIFQEVYDKEQCFEHLVEIADGIRDLSSHPLKKLLCSWVHPYSDYQLSLRERVDLARRFLVSSPERIQAITNEAIFQDLDKTTKSKAANLLLANEELFQHKAKILTLFKTAKSCVDILGRSSKVSYDPAFKVSFSKILQWHDCIVTPEFSSEESLILFNKLCKFVKRGGTEISKELMDFLLSFDPHTRPGVAEILLTKEEERLDILAKSRKLLFFNEDPSNAKKIIKNLNKFSNEERGIGFQEVVTLTNYCVHDSDYPSAVVGLYAFSEEERCSLIPHFKTASRATFSGEEMVCFLELLACFQPKERLASFKKVENLLSKDLWGVYRIEEAFKRLSFQSTISLEKVVKRMQEFLGDFTSSLNRALLVRICSRKSWMEELRTLVPFIKEHVDEDKRGLFLLLTFIPEEKRTAFLEKFEKASGEGSLANKVVLDFFLALPEKDRKYSFLSICCDRFGEFFDREKEWIHLLKQLLRWTPPDQYEAVFRWLESPECCVLGYLPECFFRSPFTHTILPYVQQLLSKPMFPTDQSEMYELMIHFRRGLGITWEHPLMQEAIKYKIDHIKEVNVFWSDPIKRNFQAYQTVLERQRTTSPYKPELNAKPINNRLIKWNLDCLQKEFYKPYTFADLPPKVFTTTFEKLFGKISERYPWVGPLSIKSPYPALIDLKGEPQESIPTAKFYLHMLLSHFQKTDVQEMMGMYFYNFHNPIYEIEGDTLKNLWSAYCKKNNMESSDVLDDTFIGFQHALGYCYYNLPVHQRIYEAKPQSSSQFILKCFKTSLQKVFYQTITKLATSVAKCNCDNFIITLQNLLSRHVGFPHLTVYPDRWNKYYPALREDEATEDQLVDGFFIFATPLEVINEIIADSRTLIANNYWPALADALSVSTDDRRYLDHTDHALNEEGAINILQKLGVIKCVPTDK